MKIREIITEYVSAADLEQIEQNVNSVWDDDNVEINLHRRGKERGGESHFLHRVNDPRNKPPIEPKEIEDVFMTAHEFNKPRNKLKHMPPGKEAVIVDPASRVNIPVVAGTNKNRETKIIPKTVMRKKDFLTGLSAEKINLPTTDKKPEKEKFKDIEQDDTNLDRELDQKLVKEPNGKLDMKPKSQQDKNQFRQPSLNKVKIDPSRIGKF